MSMSDTPMSDLRIDSEMRRPARMNGLLPRAETPIVPKNSIAGRALVAVVAIMTFLSSLTVGAVMLVRSAAQHDAAVANYTTVVDYLHQGPRVIGVRAPSLSRLKCACESASS